RKVLTNLGVRVDEVRNSGSFTSCCGGPAESVSPALSKEVMERRVDELRSTEAPIVAMCPICLGNLRKSGADVEDLSSLIAHCAL
ncbi:MAG: heterodisulfide reductase-related iron-sulfur binding cluster, partial [Deltaproteobacteria bacterium]